MGATETTSADPREARLPKWAQDELATLRRRVADAEERATEARLNSGPADSDVLMDPYDPTPIRLGRRAHIRFLANGAWADVTVRYPTNGPAYIEVMSEGMAAGGMVVQPQATNVIRIRP